MIVVLDANTWVSALARPIQAVEKLIILTARQFLAELGIVVS